MTGPFLYPASESGNCIATKIEVVYSLFIARKRNESRNSSSFSAIILAMI